MPAPGCAQSYSCPVHEIGAAQLLDAIPDAAAVIDSTGVIVGVNRAWAGFSRDNDGEEATTSLGVNYVAVCRRAAAAGDADAARCLSDLQAVLAGESRERDLEYACATPEAVLWFTTRITAIPGSSLALVTHVDITRQKNAEALLQRRLAKDPLTGLLNRSAFSGRLEQMLAGPHDVTVVFLDLDGFKPVNDVYGHAAGDEVLRRVAGRLVEALPERATVSRLGGDEFVVALTSPEGARTPRLGGELVRAVSRPMTVRGSHIAVRASVGEAMSRPGDTPESILHRADQEMYRRKKTLAESRVVLA